MRSLNVVALTGKLVAEPELRYFASGTSLLTLRFCFWTSKKDGDAWKETGNFIDIKQFKPSENFVKMLHKGTPLAISGTLEVEEWNDKATNQKRSKAVIIAREMSFAGPKPDNDTPDDPQTLAPIEGFKAQQGTIPLAGGEETPF